MLRVNEPILVLELFLRGSDGKELERVIVEMNKAEAKAFVGKLKEIEKVRILVVSTLLGGAYQSSAIILTSHLNMFTHPTILAIAFCQHS